MTCSADRLRAAVGTIAVASVFAGCSTDAPTSVPASKEAKCNGVSASVRTLAPFESVVLTGTTAACFAVEGNERTYLVMPQLAGESLPYGGYGFRLGDTAATITARRADDVTSPPPSLSANALFGVMERGLGAQALLDARMRSREQAWAATRRAPDRPLLSVAGINGLPDTLRKFSVLSTLAETAAYANVTARLRYNGSRVLIYMDTLASASLTSRDIAAMGGVYDTSLVPAVSSTFGTGSDIDGNAKVIFLLTPTVNALVTATACTSSGFVRGFFYSHDLSSSDATSTQGEIFYAYVPDEAGRWSCSHPTSEVQANLPPTFIHELQHMVSFGEHAIKRSGVAEEAWLNEGLSHMAEEIGSRVFESRYPAPTGRASATQMFPDSSAAFITPNALYSYRYLFSSGIYSITRCAPGTFCSLAERGGTWLFLRWQADQRPVGFFRQLVETNRTGRANLEAATGRSTAALLGDFAVAVSADSVVGQSRNAAPSATRFVSRNLRRLYKGLFDTVGLPGGVSRPFPVEPLTLAPASQVTGTMRPGTFMTYRLRIPAGTPSSVLRFTASDGSTFPAESGAQVSVLRLP